MAQTMKMGYDRPKPSSTWGKSVQRLSSGYTKKQDAVEDGVGGGRAGQRGEKQAPDDHLCEGEEVALCSADGAAGDGPEASARDLAIEVLVQDVVPGAGDAAEHDGPEVQVRNEAGDGRKGTAAARTRAG